MRKDCSRNDNTIHATLVYTRRFVVSRNASRSFFFFFFLKQHRYTSLYTGIKEERARAQLLSIDSIDANIVVGVVDHVAIMPVSQVKRINDDESFLSRARLLDKTLGRSRCVSLRMRKIDRYSFDQIDLRGRKNEWQGGRGDEKE